MLAPLREAGNIKNLARQSPLVPLGRSNWRGPPFFSCRIKSGRMYSLGSKSPDAPLEKSAATVAWRNSVVLPASFVPANLYKAQLLKRRSHQEDNCSKKTLWVNTFVLPAHLFSPQTCIYCRVAFKEKVSPRERTAVTVCLDQHSTQCGSHLPCPR